MRESGARPLSHSQRAALRIFFRDALRAERHDAGLGQAASGPAFGEGTLSGRLSGEVLDDVDEFGSVVSVVLGEVEEVSGSCDDGALFGVGGDREPAAATELDEPLVSEGAQGSQYGVGVHADDSGKIAGAASPGAPAATSSSPHRSGTRPLPAAPAQPTSNSSTQPPTSPSGEHRPRAPNRTQLRPPASPGELHAHAPP